MRHAIGRIFNRWVRLLVLPGLADTQCGFKLFSATAAETLFPRLTIDGFAFDVELLVLARRAGFEIQEAGIVWHGRADSRVAVARGAAAFGDVLKIWWNAVTGATVLWRRGRRDARPAAAGATRRLKPALYIYDAHAKACALHATAHASGSG